MSLVSHLLERVAHLPPPQTRAISVRRNIEIRMPDGVTLLADRYRARHDGTQPVILMRSPYGRDGIQAFAARAFAERGFQVVVQSCRGTFGSGGEFNAYRDEAGDGLATLGWLEAQPWAKAGVAMFGPSYLGIVQWAVAADPHATLRALAPAITSSRVRTFTYPAGSFSLASTLAWLEILAAPRRTGLRQLSSRLDSAKRLARGFATTPLAGADRMVTGERVPFYQDWLARQDDDAFWAPVEFDRHLADVSAPVTMVSGWYDMFLPVQLADYRELREAGREARLTIGPWKHVDPGCFAESLRDALDWFGVQLQGKSSPRPSRVRIFVGGSRRWLDLDEWPPPSRPVRWHLHPGGGLQVRPAQTSEPDRYRYDPADPTPSVGGTVLGRAGGPKDNRELERRSDVLVYTSPALVRDIEIAGNVSAQLHVRSSLERTDFFVRVCDVDPSGASRNICDGLVRLSAGMWQRGAGGVASVTVELWPAAHVFRRDHRIRVQVSSGAHPRFARNLGGGDPFGSATTMLVADQELWHDGDHPSAIVLPVRDESG
jgi:putative CocE/NonD family hydrolase